MRNIVLVTGGAGYIGAHVCKALATQGYVPVVFDDFSSGHREAVRWGVVVEGDIRDAAAVDRTFRMFRPDSVVHLAGRIAVGESVVDPADYYDVNLCGLATVLNAMRAHRVADIVFSGSASVYGAPDRSPIPEDAPLRPESPYAFSKFAGERILADYAKAYALRPVTLRYFNAAGADPAGEIGEAHDPETHLVPSAIRAALGVGPELRIFGDDFPTPDGTAVRDYVHVDDLAMAHVRAIEALKLDAPPPAAINIGSGEGASVREVVAAVERALGRPVPRRVDARRAGDSPNLVASIERARRCLGWSPKRSDLDTIVTTALRWHLGDGARAHAAHARAAKPARLRHRTGHDRRTR